MKKYKLKNDTMNESQKEEIYIYPFYPRDSKMFSDKIFVSIDNGSMNATHWICFHIKDNKSYDLDSFGGAPGKFLLKKLPKPFIIS